ncbi:cysteine desulfurase [Candidatus Gottesmanbacteria bacterium]|nr:cysteine desulfurase [Candidatus Gottesmanbacteria bacterium]
MLNVGRIHKDFPIFKRLINGKPIVYLDSTASSLKPQIVIDALCDYYKNYCVNIFRGVYTLSEEATAKYEAARAKIGKFIASNNPSEVIFTRNATESINLVAYAWGRQNIDARSEIISTVMEHHANLVTWQQLALETGAKIKYIDFDNEGYLNLEELRRTITPKTKMVAVTYVSNVLGTINPVDKIVRMVKNINPKIVVLIDAAQAVPHMKVDVEALGCDFFAFSGHKMLGPTGIGILWGKYQLLEKMMPYQLGGEMIKVVTLAKTTFNIPPYKFEAGTPNIAGALGLAAAVEYLSQLNMEQVREHEKILVKYALERFNSLNYIRIYGPKDPEKKGGVIAFNINGIHTHDVAQILNNDNVFIRSGHHCAMPLHTRLGISASCRASFYVYNTQDDIDKLIDSMQKTKRIFK